MPQQIVCCSRLLYNAANQISSQVLMFKDIPPRSKGLKLMAIIGEARSPDLAGEIAPKVLEKADEVVYILNDILLPQGEKLQETKQTSKVHWDDFTNKVKNALKATKDLGDRLQTMINDARSDDNDARTMI